MINTMVYQPKMQFTIWCWSFIQSCFSFQIKQCSYFGSILWFALQGCHFATGHCRTGWALYVSIFFLHSISFYLPPNFSDQFYVERFYNLASAFDLGKWSFSLTSYDTRKYLVLEGCWTITVLMFCNKTALSLWLFLSYDLLTRPLLGSLYRYCAVALYSKVYTALVSIVMIIK